MTCDWWIAIRFVCFCVSRVVALFLKSTVGLILVLSFVNFFTLKRDKFRFQRWNFSYRAFISRGNTDTEGSKRTDTFPLTFKFADKHSGYYGNSLIDVTEKFKFGACSIWIVEDVGRGFYLFLTYLGRLKETVRRVGFQVLQLKSGGASCNALLHSPRISLWLWKASWYFPNDVGQL